MLPSGKRLHNYGKSPFLMGKSTISMAMFNSKLLNYQRVFFILLRTPPKKKQGPQWPAKGGQF